VGCITCAGLCKEGAISFPSLSILKNIKDIKMKLKDYTGNLMTLLVSQELMKRKFRKLVKSGI
jgi:ferredoxin